MKPVQTSSVGPPFYLLPVEAHPLAQKGKLHKTVWPQFEIISFVSDLSCCAALASTSSTSEAVWRCPQMDNHHPSSALVATAEQPGPVEHLGWGVSIHSSAFRLSALRDRFAVGLPAFGQPLHTQRQDCDFNHFNPLKEILAVPSGLCVSANLKLTTSQRLKTSTATRGRLSASSRWTFLHCIALLLVAVGPMFGLV